MRVLVMGVVEDIRQQSDQKTGEVLGTRVTVRDPFLKASITVGKCPVAWLDKKSQPKEVQVWVDLGVIKATSAIYATYFRDYDGTEMEKAYAAMAALGA